MHYIISYYLLLLFLHIPDLGRALFVNLEKEIQELQASVARVRSRRLPILPHRHLVIPRTVNK